MPVNTFVGGGFLRTAVIRLPKLLRAKRMAVVVKLHCRIRNIGQRQFWTVTRLCKGRYLRIAVAQF